MGRIRTAKTYKDQCRGLVDAYRAAGNAWPARANNVAAWAIREGLWEPPRSSIVSRCAKDISDAMRDQYFTDAQGRRVRVFHAATETVGGKQMTLWADIRTADEKHMRVAIQQRRQQILGECRQLKIDVDSFNSMLPLKLPSSSA